MRPRNISKIIEGRRDKINPQFDLDVSGFYEFSNGDKWDVIQNAFIYGYEMGVRAAKAEAKSPGDTDKKGK